MIALILPMDRILYVKAIIHFSAFEETILKRENESKSIDQFFPGFLEWSTSGGTTNQDWYLRPKE